MRIGYARVSTTGQNLDLQLDRLEEAGCEKIYEEQISGAADSRPKLERCLKELREGDTLIVWRLNRFGRSLKDLVSKMEALEEKDVDFVSLTEGIDTTTAQGNSPSTSSGPWPSSNANCHGSERVSERLDPATRAGPRLQDRHLMARPDDDHVLGRRRRR